MFKDNKYTKCYYSIINRATSRNLVGYYETHHIVPKSLGGSDDLNNLVKLTAREHYICHLLLVKMTSGEDYHKMLYCYTIMSGRKLYNSKKYQLFKREYSEINSKLRSGEGNGMFGADRKGSNNTFYGRKHSEATKQLISKKKTGVSIKLPNKTEDHKIKIGQNNKKRAKIFNLIHPIYGEFMGPLHLLHESYPEQKLRKDELWKLSAGIYKSYKGWRLITLES